FLTDRSIGPADIAREAETRGFFSLFLPEHTHIPTSRATPAPMGEPLPEQYRRTLDPFVALTIAGAATERMKLGTGVCLVAQRDPIITAKEVATLDVLSGGRFVFGIGFGWNVEEIEDHGVPYPERREIGREKVLAMKRLWTDDEASFEGKYVRIERSWAYPKPLQQPHPPVWIGGAGGPVLFRHIAEYGEGWMPIGGRGVAKQRDALRDAVERAGRDPATVPIVPMGTIPDPGKLEYFLSLGIDEVILNLPTGTRDEVLPFLDHNASVVAPFRS
ncbi:MAG: LLM class F420-dependent oxidoreductase, partial [Actinomycetota bacterium]